MKFTKGINVAKFDVIVNGNNNVKSDFNVYIKKQKNGIFDLKEQVVSNTLDAREITEVFMGVFVYEIKLEFIRFTTTDHPVSIDEIQIYPERKGTAVELHDYDKDGDLDIIRGEKDGSLTLFENIGSDIEPKFFRVTSPNYLSSINVESGYAVPKFQDVDGDGDFDVLIGSKSAGLLYYRQDSNVFVKQVGASNPFNNVINRPYMAPAFIDLESDGDIDIMVGSASFLECYVRGNQNTYTYNPNCENSYVTKVVEYYHNNLIKYKYVHDDRYCAEDDAYSQTIERATTIQMCAGECKSKTACSFFQFNSEKQCKITLDTEKFGVCKKHEYSGNNDLYQVDAFQNRYYEPHFLFLNKNNKNQNPDLKDLILAVGCDSNFDTAGNEFSCTSNAMRIHWFTNPDDLIYCDPLNSLGKTCCSKPFDGYCVKTPSNGICKTEHKYNSVIDFNSGCHRSKAINVAWKDEYLYLTSGPHKAGVAIEKIGCKTLNGKIDSAITVVETTTFIECDGTQVKLFDSTPIFSPTHVRLITIAGNSSGFSKINKFAVHLDYDNFPSTTSINNINLENSWIISNVISVNECSELNGCILGGKNILGGPRSEITRIITLPSHTGIKLHIETRRYGNWDKDQIIVSIDGIERLIFASAKEKEQKEVQFPHIGSNAHVRIFSTSDQSVDLLSWGVTKFRMESLDFPNGTVEVTYKNQQVIVPSTISATGIKNALTSLSTISNDGIRAVKTCDEYQWCSYTVTFVGAKHYEEFEMFLASTDTKPISNLVPQNVDVNHVFTGSKEINVDTYWDRGEFRYFNLTDIYLAYYIPYEIDVALHNAGGYGEKLSVTGSPPSSVVGFEIRLAKLNYSSVNVIVQPPRKTNGAKIEGYTIKWSPTILKSESTVTLFGQIGKISTISCPSEIFAPLACDCYNRPRCGNAILINGTICTVNDDIAVVTCSIAYKKADFLEVPSETTVMSTANTKLDCPLNYHPVGCNCVGGESCNILNSLQVVNGSCYASAVGSTQPTSLKFVTRCASLNGTNGEAYISQISMLNTGGQLVEDQRLLTTLINKIDSHQTSPYIFSVAAHNFFGKSIFIDKSTSSPDIPQSAKARVLDDGSGINVFYSPPKYDNGGIMSNYLLKVRATTENRLQRLYFDYNGRKCCASQTTAINCIDVTTSRVALTWNGQSTSSFTLDINLSDLQSSIAALSSNVVLNITRSVSTSDFCPTIDIIFLHQDITIDVMTVDSSMIKISSIPLEFWGMGSPTSTLTCIKGVFLANRIPYTIEVAACNSLGCGDSLVARVGPPNDIKKLDIQTKWRNISAIEVSAKLKKPEEAYVDSAKVTWRWKPPNNIQQNIRFDTLPKTARRQKRAMFYDSLLVENSRNNSVSTIGSMISKPMSEWGAFDSIRGTNNFVIEKETIPIGAQSSVSLLKDEVITFPISDVTLNNCGDTNLFRPLEAGHTYTIQVSVSSKTSGGGTDSSQTDSNTIDIIPIISSSQHKVNCLSEGSTIAISKFNKVTSINKVEAKSIRSTGQWVELKWTFVVPNDIAANTVLDTLNFKFNDPSSEAATNMQKSSLFRPTIIEGNKIPRDVINTGNFSMVFWIPSNFEMKSYSRLPSFKIPRDMDHTNINDFGLFVEFSNGAIRATYGDSGAERIVLNLGNSMPENPSSANHFAKNAYGVVIEVVELEEKFRELIIRTANGTASTITNAPVVANILGVDGIFTFNDILSMEIYDSILPSRTIQEILNRGVHIQNVQSIPSTLKVRDTNLITNHKIENEIVDGSNKISSYFVPQYSGNYKLSAQFSKETGNSTLPLYKNTKPVHHCGTMLQNNEFSFFKAGYSYYFEIYLPIGISNDKVNIQAILPSGKYVDQLSSRHFTCQAPIQSAGYKIEIGEKETSYLSLFGSSPLLLKTALKEFIEIESVKSVPATCNSLPSGYQLDFGVSALTQFNGVIPRVTVILVTDDTSLDYTAEVTFAATTATFRDSKDITIPVETIGEFGYFDIRNLICVGKVDHQFDIKMCNAYGCSNVVTFDVQPLLAPTTLRSVEVTAGTVSISWDELIQDPGNLPLKYYQVEYRDESGGENDYDIAPTIRATDGPKKFMLGGLWHSKRIFIRVKAYNAFNDWAKKTGLPERYYSDSSEIIKVFTKKYTGPSAPSVPTLISKTGGAITVEWNLPFDTGGLELSKFYFYHYSTIAKSGYIERSDGAQSRYQVPDYDANSTNTFELGGLSPYTYFEFSVQYSNAAEACFGPGALSPTLKVFTGRMTAPGSASSPTEIQVTGGMVSILVQKPVDAGGFKGGITGYKVLLRRSGEQHFNVVYSGFNNILQNIVIPSLNYKSMYELVSVGLSYINYDDYVVSLKGSSKSNGTKVEISPFRYGGYDTTAEVWINFKGREQGENAILIQIGSKDRGEGMKLSIEKDTDGKEQLFWRVFNEKGGVYMHTKYDDGFPKNIWIHIACTQTITEDHTDNWPLREEIGKLYINGMLIIDGSMPQVRKDIYNINQIGSIFGEIDELRLYKHAKTQDDIRRDIMMSFTSTRDKMALYFSFDNVVVDHATGYGKDFVIEPAFFQPALITVNSYTRSCLRLWRILEGQGNVLRSSSWEEETLTIDLLHVDWKLENNIRAIICLDGAKYIPVNTPLIPDNAFTISIWMSALETAGIAWTLRDNTNNFHSQLKFNQNGELQFSHFNGGELFCRNITANDGEMHHLVVTYDNLNYRIYMNGNQCAVKNIVGNMTQSTNLLLITFGGDTASRNDNNQPASSNYIGGLNGCLKMLSLFSFALNTEEVNHVKNGFYIDLTPVHGLLKNGARWINSTRGDGDFSKALLIKTAMNPTTPSAPRKLRSKVATGGALYVEWDTPTDTGGVDVKEYRLYEVTLNGLKQIGKDDFITKSNSFVVYNLNPLTTYFFQAKAINMHNLIGTSSETVQMVTTEVSPPGLATDIEVVIASDELLILKWEPPKDNGGNAIKEYELVMRSSLQKGSFKSVYKGANYEAVKISRNEYPGLYENTAYELRVRAKNDAGYGEYTPIYIGWTQDVCDVVPGCLGGKALTLGWSDCGNSSSILFKLHRLAYPHGLNESAAEATLSEDIIYTGSNQGITLWDLPTDTNTVHRYTVHIYTQSEGVWQSTNITSAKFRLGPTNEFPIQLGPTTPSAKEDLKCRSQNMVFASGPYNNNADRAWIIYPTTIGKSTLMAFKGIEITFLNFNIECNYDSLSLVNYLTKAVLWEGGCVRGKPFTLTSYLANTPLSLVLKSDDSFANADGILVSFRTLFDTSGNVPGTIMQDATSCPGTINNQCNGNGHCVLEGNQYRCKCSPAFIGEDCMWNAFCETNFTENVTYVPTQSSQLCVDRSKIFALHPNGADSVATGGTGTVGFPYKGSNLPPKAVLTLGAAAERATAGQHILLYPGIYKGQDACESTIISKTINVSSMYGSNKTMIDCSYSIRAITLIDSIVTMKGISFKGGIGPGAVHIELRRSNLNFYDALFQIGGANGYSLFAMDRSHFNLTNATFYRNIGGAIRVTSDTVGNLETIIFRENLAHYGGALNIQDNSFINIIGAESYDHQSYLTGGFAYVSSNSTLNLSKLSSVNSFSKNGGFLHVEKGGKSYLKEVSIKQSTADLYGGSFYVSNHGELNVLNSTAIQTKAKDGGLIATFKNTYTTIETLWSIKSEGDKSGGVLYSSGENNNVLISSSSFNNSKSPRGGFIFQEKRSMVNVQETVFEKGVAENGGFVYIKNAMLSMTNTNIEDISAKSNGGAIFMNMSSLILNLCNFAKSYSFDKGGTAAMYGESSLISLPGPTVVKNTTSINDGGFAVTFCDNCTIQGFQVIKSTSKTGAGVFAQNSETNLLDMYFEDNHASANGGMCFSKSSNVYLNRVKSFKSTSLNGGTIYIENSVMHIEKLESNVSYATLLGGSFYVKNSDLNIRKLSSKESSSVHGGFIFGTNDATIALLDSNINGVTAKDKGGFAYLSSSSNIKVTNSNATNMTAFERGGGFFIDEYASLELFESTFSMMRLSATSLRHGGGIYMGKNTNITASKAIFANVTADKGSCIFFDDSTHYVDGITCLDSLTVDSGALQVTGGFVYLFNTNIYSSKSLKIGGGMYIGGKSVVEAHHLHVKDCKALNGGGVYVDGYSSFLARTSLLEKNTAVVGGGAMVVSSQSSATFESCNVISNIADEGGHVKVADGSMFWAKSSVFKTARATRKGGAIAVVTGGTSTLLASYFEGNKGTYGAAVFVDGCKVEIKRCHFLRNSAGAYGYGGALYTEKQAEVRLNDTGLVDNFAAFGGAWYLTQVAKGTVYNATFEKNEAMYDGGAIFSDNSLFDLADSNCNRNEARDNGGAIMLESGAHINVLRTEFHHNAVGGKQAAGAGYGSAIFLSRSTTSNINSSKFYLNNALELGTIYSADCYFLIYDCTFDGNYANLGGGLVADRTASGILIGGLFTNNRANIRGGGIALRGLAKLKMRDTTIGPGNFILDERIAEGGGISINAFTNLEMENVIVTNNSATTGGGVAAVDQSVLTVKSSYFEHNRASDGGGIGVLDAVEFSCFESTFVNNKALFRGGGIYTTHSNCPINETHWKLCITLSNIAYTNNEAVSGGGFYWKFVNSTKGSLATAVSSDLKCTDCGGNGNFPSVGGTNPTSVSILQYPKNGVETGKIEGAAYNYQIDCTDRYGLRSAFDSTTICKVFKASTEKGDIGIEGGESIANQGIVKFPELVFKGNGEKSYDIFFQCLIANTIEEKIETSVTINWCKGGFAPVARICRPCQAGEYSPFGKWCLECPKGGNCTSLVRTKDGLPMGVGYPRSKPGFWLHVAPSKALKKRCPPGWDDFGPCKPGEKLLNATQSCEDMEWPSFQLHFCLLKFHFYVCPRGYDACPGNYTMPKIGDRKDYDSFKRDMQCATGYLNVMCGNCEFGYFPGVSDMCMPCMNSKDDEVLSKLFYAGLSASVSFMMSYAIYSFLHDGIVVGKAEKYYEKKKKSHCCTKCRDRMVAIKKKIMGLGFQVEKLKIALGLCQVLSSFRNTYDIEWPPEVVEFFKNFAVFENLDIFKLVAMDCLYKTDYFFSLKAVTLMPLFMCFVLFIIWRRGITIFKRKLALYPRTCRACHHPIDPFEIAPQEKAMREKLIAEGGTCCNFKLLRHNIYTYWMGGRYVWEIDPLDKAPNCPDDEVRNLKFAKTIVVKKSIEKFKNLKNKKKNPPPPPNSKSNKSLTQIFPTGISNGQKVIPTTGDQEARRKLSRKNESKDFNGYDASIHQTGCPKGPPPKTLQTRMGNWRMRVLLRMRFQTFKSKCLQILFWLLLVTYPSISRKILMLFKCVEIGKESYMMWDTQIECYSYMWYVHSVYAAVFSLVYIIGVPAMFFYLLFTMRESFVKENALEISTNEKMKVKFLGLAKKDSEERGVFWKKIRNLRDERKRIAGYLRRLNLRDERNRARLGFLYKFFKEEYYWFEMFEFIFKLCMTGLMVHVAPGTVSQILVGMLITFVGFGFHIAGKPYIQDSNNILMIFGKFQLFLVLFGALLLKMETPFFANDSSMQEMDVSLLSNMVIYSTVLLLVVWVATIGHDIYISKKVEKEKMEIRKRTQENKRKYHLMKGKISMIGSLSFVEEENRSPKVGGKDSKDLKKQLAQKKKKKGLKVRPTYHIKQTKLSKKKTAKRNSNNAARSKSVEKSKKFWGTDEDNGSKRNVHSKPPPPPKETKKLSPKKNIKKKVKNEKSIAPVVKKEEPEKKKNVAPVKNDAHEKLGFE
jgi:hypothetical protein